MSYNISGWETVELDALTVPLEAVKRCKLEAEWDSPTRVFINAGEGAIEGELKGDTVYISKLYISGEGSGRDMDRVLALLKHSKGTLVAFLTWEGGDSFNLIEAKDGVVTETGVDPAELLRRIRQLEAELKKCNGSSS